MLDADEFKNCARTYAQLDDEIKTATRHISELKKRRDAIGLLVLGFMKHHGLDECELQQEGGKLVRRESKRTEPLKKDHIVTELMALLGNDTDRAQSSLNNMLSKRSVEVKDTLSRTSK